MSKLMEPFKTRSDPNQVHNIDQDAMEGSIGRRWTKLMSDFSTRRGYDSSHGSWHGGKQTQRLSLRGFYYSKDASGFKYWQYFMVIMSIFSSMFTPFQFGFFPRGLSRALWILDLVAQVPFILDLISRFFRAYKDPETMHHVTNHKLIAKRYFKKDFVIELYNCLPWDSIYKGTGHHEAVRCLVWGRVYRAKKLQPWFNMLEKDIRFNYFIVRIMKLLFIEAFVTHSAACFYYYLATTVKTRSQGYTWMGSLALGSFSYTDFRQISLGKRYVTSLYWSVVTLTTVGYGDIHAVNIREMIFIMIYISFNMLLGSYLIGNVSALVVKGSATEQFRSRMASLTKYMNRHHLPPKIRKQMKNHVLLQFETGTLTDDEIASDLPDGVRAKVANSIYRPTVEKVPLFRKCSSEFLHEIVSKMVVEHFLPGEVIIQQGGASDNLYVICDGVLDEIIIHGDGSVEMIERHTEGSIVGEVGVLCNIPQPYTVRANERSRVLRLDKHAFNDLTHIYFNDGRQLVNNLFEMKDTDPRIKQIATDVDLLVSKQAAELALMVNNAAYQGDLEQLKLLVKQGADVTKADYDGRTALHLAAFKGYEAIVEFLIKQRSDVSALDVFGDTPLLEAVRGAHDNCVTILKEKGAQLKLEDAGCFLCEAVHEDNNELVRRLLVAGVDPSATDYDKRTAIHLAAAEGHIGLVKLLIQYGANVKAEDRWGNTPLDEAETNDHGRLIPILNEASNT